MDTIAILLVDDSIKENAGVFQEARGYQMMLQIIVTRPNLRKEALKILSFALIKCGAPQAVEFVERTKGLGTLFGLWARQPEHASVLTKEQAKLHEYFLSIFWNLLSAL